MKFSLTKVAIAIACMHGSIHVDPTANGGYLEDQSFYSQVTNELIQGWHWGLSSANACTSQSDTDCMQVVSTHNWEPQKLAVQPNRQRRTRQCRTVLHHRNRQSQRSHSV